MKSITSLLKFTLIFFAVVSNQCVYAQNWALMYGSCASTLAPAYGTMGVASATTHPGGRMNGCSLKDAAGNLWLFGGYGNISAGNQGFFNDLWRFDLNSNQWTWMKGANSVSQPASYGAQGVSTPTNDPGSRMGSLSWVDGAGNFWIFGGENSSSSTTMRWFLNDLWKYTVSTNQWTWISGSNAINNSGAYGTKGVASATNMPMARAYGSSWIDSNGNLWLFGGRNDNNGGSYFDDVWMYNPATNQWTWMNGSNIPNVANYYATLGVASVSNTPGSRMGSTAWTDNSGNFWLFGGVGYPTTGFANDMWRYTKTTNEWTCVNAYASPGTTYPIGRQAACGWKDNAGNFWLYGGVGGTGTQSELWNYSVASNLWTLALPASTAAVCYASGVASPANKPSPAFLSQHWVDNCGNFWVQGGDPFSLGSTLYLNALWKLNRSGVQNTTPASALHVCAGNSTTLTTTGGGTVNWYSSPSSTVSIATGNTILTGSLSVGTHSFYAEPSTCTMSITRTEILVEVHSPTVSIAGSNSICAGGSVTLTAAGAASYSWSNGATGTTLALNPSITTHYSVVGTDSYGCMGIAGKTLTVNSLPVLSLAGTNTTCAGSSITQTLSGASTYSWSNGATTATVSLTPSTSTSYTAFGTSTANCSSMLVFSINVLPVPFISVNSGIICANEIFTLQPLGGASGFTFSSGTNTVSPLSNTIYSVSSVGLNGCVAIAMSTVLVNPLPVITAANGTVCPAQSFTIAPAGAASYTFSSGSAIVSPSVTTVYSITGTSAAGCLSQFPGIVQVSAFPNPTIAVSNGTVCFGQSFLVQASGANTYSCNGGSMLLYPVSNGTYAIVGVSNAGCVSPSVVCSVSVKSQPTITIVSSNPILCTGEFVTLTAQGASTYTWNTGAFSNAIQISPLVTTNYSAQGTDSSGCNNTASFQQAVDACVQFAETDSKNFKIYPIPTKGVLIIELESMLAHQELKIFNATGALVTKQNLVQLKTEITLSEFSKGIYTVIIFEKRRPIKQTRMVVE